MRSIRPMPAPRTMSSPTPNPDCTTPLSSARDKLFAPLKLFVDTDRPRAVACRFVKKVLGRCSDPAGQKGVPEWLPVPSSGSTQKKASASFHVKEAQTYSCITARSAARVTAHSKKVKPSNSRSQVARRAIRHRTFVRSETTSDS